MSDHLTLQRQLAGYLRNPQAATAPSGVPEPRLAVYQELMFNNLRSFLDAGFPVSAEILGPEHWETLTRRFWAEHACQSPYFVHITREFREWVATHDPGIPTPDYLNELMHYEWLELEIDVRTVDEPGITKVSDPMQLAEGVPVLAPTSEGFLYRYPVHRLSKEYSELDPVNTALIVFRNQADEVEFIQVNPLTLSVFEQLKSGALSGIEAIATVLQQQGMEVTEATLGFGLGILNDWLAQGLIWGVSPFQTNDR